MFRLTKDEVIYAASLVPVFSAEQDAEELCFPLRSQIVTSKEFDIKEVEGKSSGLRSQVATSNRGRGGRRYLPFAFTSLGVAMLSSVLKSETAIAVNREIMRTFVSLSQLVKAPIPDNNADLRREIESLRREMNDILADQNDINEETRAQLDAISQTLAEMQAKDAPTQKLSRKPIGFAAYQQET